MDIIYTIWLRNMKRYIRSKSRIIGSISMPLFFLLFLGFGLNSVVRIPGLGENYIVFLIPGMVAMSVLFTSIFSGIQIIWDKQFGFLKETLVAPVSRLEIMLGQTFGGATTAVLQGFMILVLSLFIGLKVSGLTGFLIAFAFMVLIGISFTAFGIAIASRMEDMTGFQLDHEFCRLSDIRPVRGTVPDQFTAGLGGTGHHARPAHLRGGRDPVRSYRGLTDQPAGLCCSDRQLHGRNDSPRGIPVQEDQALNKELRKCFFGRKKYLNPERSISASPMPFSGHMGMITPERKS